MDSWGIKYKGVGTDYLATLNTAQPCGVEGKGDCDEPHFHDNQLPTPYFGGKKGEGPYVSLEAFPLKRLQVVVNRVRPGHGGKAAMVESLGGRAAHSRLGLSASVTDGRARQVGRGTAAQDALVPLVGGPNKPAGARPAAWGPIPFFLLT